MVLEVFILGRAWIAVGLLVVFGLWPGDSHSYDRSVFEISREIVVKNPPRFGTNLSLSAWVPWGSSAHNIYVKAPNPEGILVRLKGYAVEGGRDRLSAPFIPHEAPGVSYWNVFREHFFDGARIDVYRLEHDTMYRVRTDTVAEFLGGGPDSANRIRFSESGPEVRESDMYVLTHEFENFSPETLSPSWKPEYEWKVLPRDDARATLSIDSTSSPVEGGRASFRLESDVDEGAAIVQGWISRNPGWRKLVPGRTYRFSVWMRHRDMRLPTVTVNFGNIAQTSFQVTETWQKYEFDFTGPTDIASHHGPLRISMSSEGTLWLDNILLYDKVDEPYALDRRMIAELESMRPGVIRIWSGLEKWGQTLDNWLALELRKRWTLKTRGAIEGATGSLGAMLRLCKKVGADPWLLVSPAFTPEEWQGLAEYLAGDPSSRYGQVRVEEGQVAPWTEVFNTIYLEMGNETWNRGFDPWTFRNGREYGAFSRLMFESFLQGKESVREKVRFILGGWAAQKRYGEDALNVNPHADYLAISSYLSGWDGVSIPGRDDDKIFSDLLTFYPRVLEAWEDKHEEIVGDNTRLAVYESGPGYHLPGTGESYASEEDEYIGKSLAAAITTIDGFLERLRQNYGPQLFHTFANGIKWTSHTVEWTPHAVWLGLSMRNRYALGDLMESRTVEVPTSDLPAETLRWKMRGDNFKSAKVPRIADVPMVSLYPFRSGNRWSYMILSRRLKEATDVTLRVPYDPKNKAIIYKLSGDAPGESNRQVKRLAIESETRHDFDTDYTIRVAPHSLYVLVNEER